MPRAGIPHDRPETSRNVATAKSQLAHREKAHKNHPSQQAAHEVVEARRVLAEEKIRQFIERTVASAPPLNQTQRDRLAALFSHAVDPR